MKIVINTIIYCLIGFVFSIIFNVDFVKQNHFNLITVDSVLVGFLFTSLSILLTFLNERVVQFFEEANLLENIYHNIIKGMLTGIFSIAIAVANLIFIEQLIVIKKVMNVVYSLEIILMLATILSLFIAILDTKNLINSIRVDKKKQNNSDIANKLMEERFGTNSH